MTRTELKHSLNWGKTRQHKHTNLKPYNLWTKIGNVTENVGQRDAEISPGYTDQVTRNTGRHTL